LTWAQVALSALGVVKEVFLTFLAFLVQYERIKGKKTEDQLELMKSDKGAEDAKKAIQQKADATTARAGIDEFLQR
jgi:hypothetical protein